ncbi:hypothetical protein KXW95_003043, partial [Aspergillus fumigatus]
PAHRPYAQAPAVPVGPPPPAAATALRARPARAWSRERPRGPRAAAVLGPRAPQGLLSPPGPCWV